MKWTSCTKHLVLALALLATGCATPLQDYQPELSVIKEPEIGKEASAELGDTLVKYAVRNEYEAIRILDTVKYNVCMYSGTVEPQDAIAVSREPSNGSVVYEVMTTIGGTGASHKGRWGAVKDSSGGYSLAPTMFLSGGCGSKQKMKNRFTEVRIPLMGDPGFSQEIIYNGRIGDSLKFVYREFQNNLARGAFSQEAQYDLSESNIIGFKNVRIEVLEASNTSIRYIVRSHFEGTGY